MRYLLSILLITGALLADRPYLEVDYSTAGALENTTFGAIKALFAL